MGPRSGLAPVVVSGVGSALKLLVATLAFTGAYMGAEGPYSAAGSRASGAGGAPVRTVVLTSRSAVSAVSVTSARGGLRPPATPRRAADLRARRGGSRQLPSER